METKRASRGKKSQLCYFCNQKFVNYARHLIQKHRNQVIFKHFRCTSIHGPKGCLLTKFRRTKKPPANQLSKRHQKLTKMKCKKKITSKYTLCLECRGMFKKNFFITHKEHCGTVPRQESSFHVPSISLEIGNENYVSSTSNSIKENHDFYNSLNIQNILNTMRSDEAATAGRGDILICCYADKVFKQTKGQTVRDVVSNTVRELGRLLVQLRNMTGMERLIDYLRPQHFDQLLEATKKISGYDPELKRFETTYLPIKMGRVLREICKMALKMISKGNDIFALSNNMEMIRCLQHLTTLIDQHWSSDLLELQTGTTVKKECNSASDLSDDEDDDYDARDENTFGKLFIHIYLFKFSFAIHDMRLLCYFPQ